MKIPIAFLTIAVSAVVALQAWTLNEIVNLKTDVATLKILVNQNHNLTQK